MGDFLCLMRNVYDQEDEERLTKEQAVIQQVHFAPSEIRDFRELFLSQDVDGSGMLDFDEIETMVDASSRSVTRTKPSSWASSRRSSLLALRLTSQNSFES